MPKKRKRGADLHCRKKHNRPGRAIIRMRINGIEKNIKNHFKSTEANSNIDIAMFDVTEFEKEREELNEKKKKITIFSSDNVWRLYLFMKMYSVK